MASAVRHTAALGALGLLLAAGVADAQEASTGAAPSAAAPAPAPAPPPATPLSAKVVYSQFADLPVSGDAAKTLRYGGKIDGYFDIKGSAVGASAGWKLHVHPEFRYGNSANGLVGLLPSNTELYYPANEGGKFDLSINLTKSWASGASLTVGKVNVLDLAAQLPVVGGGGHEGFENLALALPPSAIVPSKLTGALLTVPTGKVLYRLWVFDPDVQSRRSGLEDPFSHGVGFLGSATVPVKLGGHRGYYALKLAGSTRRGIAADALPPVLVPAPGSGFGDSRGEFSAVLAAYQYLAEYPEHPGAGIGVFGQVYVSAGDPTFLDKSGFVGVSGNPRGRPQDRFGLTYFHYSLTDGLVSALAARVALEDEEGVEAFYTVQLAKPLRVTGDVQVVDSAIAARDLGVIAGLRVTATF